MAMSVTAMLAKATSPKRRPAQTTLSACDQHACRSPTVVPRMPPPSSASRHQAMRTPLLKAKRLSMFMTASRAERTTVGATAHSVCSLPLARPRKINCIVISRALAKHSKGTVTGYVSRKGVSSVIMSLRKIFHILDHSSLGRSVLFFPLRILVSAFHNNVVIL